MRRFQWTLLLAFPCALTAQQARVDSLFAQYDAQPSPGLAVAVVKDGKLVLSRGYGLASLEHRVPVSGTTVFDIASISKQFAGLSIAMLVREGKVDLDADISRYVPEMAPLTANHPITIRHLLHHTSGLRDWPSTLALAGWRMDDVISYDQILRFAYAQRSLNFPPGSAYSYSNTGYNLLAETVTRVSGRSFATFTRERIFAPLGMSHSHFQDDHAAVVANRAFGYGRTGAGTFSLATDNLTALGSSSLFSTVEDLAKWVINFETASVGGREAMAMTRTRGRLTNGDSIPYAFGVSHGTHRGFPTVAHSGSWAQFATYLIHFPQQRLGVVVLANSSIVNPGRAALDVADAFLGATAALAPDTAMRTRPAVSVPTRTLESYAGLYRLGPGWYLEIRRDGDALRTRATNEAEFPMVARSEREFWVEAYSAGVTFMPGTSGRADTLLYRGIRAPRIDGGTARRAVPSGELAQFAGIYESTELGTAYEVAVRGDSLTVSHFRHGTAPLSWTWREFVSPWWFMRSVAFERDASGRATAMVVEGGERSRANRFVRRQSRP